MKEKHNGWREQRSGYQGAISASLRLGGSRRKKQIWGVRLKHHVAAAPRLVVNETPLVPGAGRVGCDQYLTGMDDACFAVACREFERACEGDDVLTLGGFVPVERGMRRRLLDCTATTSVRWSKGSVPFSRCEALSGPVKSLKAFIAYELTGSLGCPANLPAACQIRRWCEGLELRHPPPHTNRHGRGRTQFREVHVSALVR
jgi:hypothetical protein